MGYREQVIADGATNYWRLGEPSGTSAADVVGGASGTISGGVTLGVSGALAVGDKAMRFDGTTGKIVVPTIDPLNGATAVTLEAWVNHHGAAWLVGHEMVQSWSNAGHYLSVNLGKAFFSLKISGVQHTFGIIAVPTSGWHHLVGTWASGQNALLYLDGLLVENAGAAFAGALVSAPGVEFSSFDVLGSSFFNGSLDEIAVYPVALSPAQIAAHFAISTQRNSSGVPWWTRLGAGGVVDKFNVWEPITPSNTVDLARGVTGALWVGGSGDVAAVMQNSAVPVVLAAVPAGSWLPLAVRRINATGTTATGLVALYGT